MSLNRIIRRSDQASARLRDQRGWRLIPAVFLDTASAFIQLILVLGPPSRRCSPSSCSRTC
jgi:hypothetical protein